MSIYAVYSFLMRAREIIKKLKENGWNQESQKGSHVKMKKGSKMTIVPDHGGKDVPKGTVKAIEKQTGVKLL